MTKKRTIPVNSLLRDEARRVFGKDCYLRIRRASPPFMIVAGNDKTEIQTTENSETRAYETLLACLTALPDHGEKLKKCSLCQKPGHVRKHCPDLENFLGNKIAKGLRAERQGKVKSRGGYFGATELAANIQARKR